MTTGLRHPVHLDDQLYSSLNGASMAMSRVYEPMLDRLGITCPQHLVPHALREENDRAIGGIAERLSLEPGTITPLVKRLAAAGLVERGRDPRDERHVRVALTDRARGLEADGGCLAEEVFARTGLTAEQMAALAGQIQMLRRALTADVAGA